ncbi:hypothetical protein EDC04DRAFT_2651972 [Pisolithus marmoratus]|nr:hypothetical protein EDC04DRAFT_2651972 [Pisolithus marmoratus]
MIQFDTSTNQVRRSCGRCFSSFAPFFSQLTVICLLAVQRAGHLKSRKSCPHKVKFPNTFNFRVFSFLFFSCDFKGIISGNLGRFDIQVVQK